ncbi:MAG: NAD(P)-binding domain-containing protein [Erythrobacter sp.]|nr:NAD(P)-binding domain-containing protein [Verrucomicrobiales bacterium]MBL4717661.1 NAD(P)-binding domain-containing protein [Erythrobacter sp.]
MEIGIIGSGQIGGTLARRFARAGHSVLIANSRGPASLADFDRLDGVRAVTIREAARAADVVVMSIPVKRVGELPDDLFDDEGKDVVVVDTGNYYPKERDGRIGEIEEGMTESRWTSRQIGRPVLKAFNTIPSDSLENGGRPDGAQGRIAIPVAGDDPAHKQKLFGLLDDLGFDGIDAGTLDESWRQQPGTPVYAANLDASGARRALKAAVQERPDELRA